MKKQNGMKSTGKAKLRQEKSKETKLKQRAKVRELGKKLQEAANKNKGSRSQNGKGGEKGKRGISRSSQGKTAGKMVFERGTKVKDAQQDTMGSDEEYDRMEAKAKEADTRAETAEKEVAKNKKRLRVMEIDKSGMDQEIKRMRDYGDAMKTSVETCMSMCATKEEEIKQLKMALEV